MQAPLAGNSVGTDRAFLARDMPALDGHLRYRIIDVSSIKELARRWYPRAYFASPQKAGGHRALADIEESIRELRYYREAVFVPPPGPDTDAARRLLPGTWNTPRSDRYALRTAEGPAVLAHVGGVAQPVERRPVVADVIGSSPVTNPSSAYLRLSRRYHRGPPRRPVRGLPGQGRPEVSGDQRGQPR